MGQLKYQKKLERFLKKPFFTVKEAAQQAVPKHALAYLEKKGVLERIERGIYRFSQYEPVVGFEWENLAFRASSIPEGVICLISALCYYGLTDQIMREAWVAIPHGSRAPKRSHTRIVRMRDIKLGCLEIKLGEFKVRIFDRERCIVDAFNRLWNCGQT